MSIKSSAAILHIRHWHIEKKRFLRSSYKELFYVSPSLPLMSLSNWVIEVKVLQT